LYDFEKKLIIDQSTYYLFYSKHVRQSVKRYELTEGETSRTDTLAFLLLLAFNIGAHYFGR